MLKHERAAGASTSNEDYTGVQKTIRKMVKPEAKREIKLHPGKTNKEEMNGVFLTGVGLIAMVMRLRRYYQ